MTRGATGVSSSSARASAVLLAVAFAAAGCSSIKPYNQGIAGVSMVAGGVSSHTEDSLFIGPSGVLGWRWDAVRAGVSGRALFGRDFGTGAVDFGGFVQVDPATVLLDRWLSLGVFIRADALARYVPGRDLRLVPLGAVGVHAFGIELGAAVGPEIGLNPAGLRLNVEFRVGFDLVELVSLFVHLADQCRPLPQ